MRNHVMAPAKMTPAQRQTFTQGNSSCDAVIVDSTGELVSGPPNGKTARVDCRLNPPHYVLWVNDSDLECRVKFPPGKGSPFGPPNDFVIPPFTSVQKDISSLAPAGKYPYSIATKKKNYTMTDPDVIIER